MISAGGLTLLAVLLLFEERSNDWLLNAPFNLGDHDLYVLPTLPLLGAIYFLFRRHWSGLRGWLWGYVLSMLALGVFVIYLVSDR